MTSAISLEEFSKLQIPALRHDAERLEEWRHGRGADHEVLAIAERLLKIHRTIEEQEWFELPKEFVEGLELIEHVVEERKDDPPDIPEAAQLPRHVASRQIAPLTTLFVAITRKLLGDDPGPEPHGGPLANQMAIGVKKKA